MGAQSRHRLPDSYFWGEDVFTDFEEYEKITVEYLNELLGEIMLDEYSVLSVILPLEE